MYHECLPWEGDLGVRTNKEMRPNKLEIEPNTCSQFHSESQCKKTKTKQKPKKHCFCQMILELLNIFFKNMYIDHLLRKKNQSIKYKLSPKSQTVVRKHGKAQWPCCKQIF